LIYFDLHERSTTFKPKLQINKDQSNPNTPSKLLLDMAVKYKFKTYLLLYLGSYSRLKQVCPLG